MTNWVLEESRQPKWPPTSLVILNVVFLAFFAQIWSLTLKWKKLLVVKKDRSVFDSHEDFGDKLGLGGVKTTEVATYQTCN